MQSRERTNEIANAADLRRAYNDAYGKLQLSQLHSFYLWVFSLLPRDDRALFLDISCGTGQLVAIAADHKLPAFGVDISDRAVSATNELLGQVRACVADGEHLPFADGSLDLVTNIGSIEHYLNPENGIAEIVRVLNASGEACILLPNSYSLLENIWSVLWTGDVGDQGQPVERYATRADWERLLVRAGLSIRRVVPYNLTFPRSLKDWGWYFRRPRKLLWLAASLLVPPNLSGCFAFLCCKTRALLPPSEGREDES